MSGDGEFKMIGRCRVCCTPRVDLFSFPNGVACGECGEEDFNKRQLQTSELEDCKKYYESEDWLPEDGFDEEEK